jgi:hypothetical protein
MKLFRRLKPRRRKPFVDMGGYFGPPGSADHFVPDCARWKQFDFGSSEGSPSRNNCLGGIANHLQLALFWPKPLI